MARDGATPTIFGPSPLNNARAPSVLTIYLRFDLFRHSIVLACLKINLICKFLIKLAIAEFHLLIAINQILSNAYFKHCHILMDCELEDIPQ